MGMNVCGVACKHDLKNQQSLLTMGLGFTTIVIFFYHPY
jgi:hypothetical protein